MADAGIRCGRGTGWGAAYSSGFRGNTRTAVSPRLAGQGQAQYFAKRLRLVDAVTLGKIDPQ